MTQFSSDLYNQVIANTAIDSVGGNSEGGDKNFWYLPEGTTSLRLVPEIETNAQGQPRLVYFKPFYTHNFNFDRGVKGESKLPLLICGGRDNCPLCQMAEQLKNANVPNAWRANNSGTYLLRVFAYETNPKNSKDLEYAKVGRVSLVAVRRRVIESLTTFLNNYPAENRARIFNPTIPGDLITISFTKGTGGSANVTTYGQTVEIPNLGEDIPSLLEYEMAEPLTEQYLAAAKQNFERLMANKTATHTPGSGSPSGAAFGGFGGDFGAVFGGQPQQGQQPQGGFGQQPQGGFGQQPQGGFGQQSNPAQEAFGQPQGGFGQQPQQPQQTQQTQQPQGGFGQQTQQTQQPQGGFGQQATADTGINANGFNANLTDFLSGVTGQ